jgi:predicted ArsR family transcriptional regulator
MASYKERILGVIKESEVGLTTVDVAKQAGVSKTTAIKYLSVLKSEEKCVFVEVGPSKLWRLKANESEDSTSKEGSYRDLEDIVSIQPSTQALFEELAEDAIISMSFRVKPEKIASFMDLIKKMQMNQTSKSR